MMRAAVVVVVVVAAMAAAHPQERLIDNPTTATQVLKNIVELAVEKMKAAGWDVSKNSQNGEATLPMHEASGTNEAFEITNARIYGLTSLTNSKSASFNADKTELSGTIMVQDVSITADYTATFPGVDAAPAQTISGTVTETVAKLFADIVVNIDATTLTPLSIKSYSVRSGHDSVSASGISSTNQMRPLHLAGFRKALLQILVTAINTNAKVKVNQAIQALKAAAGLA